MKMAESDDVSLAFFKEQKALWTNTQKLSDILPRASEFDAIFYVGGHGRMFRAYFVEIIYSNKIKQPCST